MLRLSISVLTLLVLSLSARGDAGFALRVLSAKKEQIVAQPYVSPHFTFRVLAGAPKGYVYDCKQVSLRKHWSEHGDDVVEVDCADGVKLELVAVNF